MTEQHWCSFALPLMALFLSTLVLAAGCTQQAAAPPAPDPVRELSAAWPPSGEILEANGSRMHIRCTGNGSPAVVLEAGSTDISLSWANVQPGVANFTRVCSYDRQGYGWSDPLDGPITARGVTNRLHSLLGAANVSPPYVLVGHSLGGEYMRYYATRYPDDVAGIVLVDPGSEWQMVRTGDNFTREQQAAIHTAVLGIRAMGEKAKDGTFAANLSLVPADPRLPAYEFHAYQALLATRPSFWEARAVEAESAFSIFSELQQAEITLPENIPLIVIASGNDMGFSQDPANNAEANAIFRTLQQEIARESANGTYRVAPDTTHYVQLDRPDIVIDAIRSVVDAARSR